jgi:hypothetical protein
MKFKGMYRVVCISDAEEQVLSTAKVFIWQEVTITLQDNANKIPVHFDMPSNYTIDNVGAKSVVTKTLGKGKI